MKLSDLTDEPPPAVKGPDCAVGAIVTKVDEADIEWLRVRLTDPATYPTRWLSDEIAKTSHRLSASSIQRHRRGECHACAVRGRTWVVPNG